jgi:hypothetical protein
MRDDGVGYVCNRDRDLYIIRYEGQHNNYVRLGSLPRGKSQCLFESEESGVKIKGERRMMVMREKDNTRGRAAKQIVECDDARRAELDSQPQKHSSSMNLIDSKRRK